MQFPTKPLLDLVLVLWQTPPGLLTQCKVRRMDVIKGPTPTIFAVLLSSPAIPVHNVVHRLLIPGVVAHLIVHTTVQLNGRPGMEVVVVVRDESLEGHGTVEWTDLGGPPLAFLEVTFSDNLLQFVVDVHRWTEND